MFAGDDPTPWRLLRDGTIVRLERDLADEVSAWIDLPYLRARFGDGGTLFRIRLARCTALGYTPFDEPPLDDLRAIAASEPGVLDAAPDGDALAIRGPAGVLRARYEAATLELDTGRALAVAELARTALDG